MQRERMNRIDGPGEMFSAHAESMNTVMVFAHAGDARNDLLQELEPLDRKVGNHQRHAGNVPGRL